MSLKDSLNDLKNREGVSRAFNNMTWLFAEKGLRIIVGLFIGAWVARYLRPENFGLLSYAQSIVFFFAVLPNLGLETIVTRDLVKYPTEKDKILGTAFFLKLIGAVFLLIGVWIFNYFFVQDSVLKSIILIISLGSIFQSVQVIDFYFQSKVLSKYFAISQSLSLFFASIFRIYLILNKADVVSFAWVLFFEVIILSIILVIFYIKESGKPKWSFKFVLARRMLKDSWPLMLSGLMVTVYMKVDQIMIKEMINAEAVGFYSAAIKLSEIWYVIPIVISNSLFPAIIKSSSLDKRTYYNRIQKLFSLLVLITILISIGTNLLSEIVITLLYGTEYLVASNVLIIHIWTGVFVGLGVASGKWLAVENLQFLSFLRTFLGMIINIVLNLALIPKHGIVGAAYAVMISGVFSGYLFDIIHPKTREIFWLKTRSLLPTILFSNHKEE